MSSSNITTLKPLKKNPNQISSASHHKPAAQGEDDLHIHLDTEGQGAAAVKRRRDEQQQDDITTTQIVSSSENAKEKEPKEIRGYRNHSFDDFQRAIDSRKLLSSNPVFWYNKLYKESVNVGSKEERNVPYKMLMSIFERSVQLTKKVARTSTSTTNNSDPELVKELLERGTLADQLKIRASQLIENPLGSLQHLDALIALFESRRHIDKVLLVLRDLFLNYLMPYRKLIQFKDRPLKTISGRIQAMEQKMKKAGKKGYAPTVDEQRTDATLMFWYFEDSLKKKYKHFLQLIDKFLSDPYIAQLQVLAVRVLRELICLIPESRSIATNILIRSLINPSVQKYSHDLILQTLDSNSFWFCPHLSRSEVVKGILRLLYESLQLSPVKAVLRINAITGTLRRIPLFRKDTDVQSLLMDGYLHVITTLRRMGRDRSFFDEGNPIYCSGMRNSLKGLESLLGQGMSNKEKFFGILTTVLSLGEIQFMDTQISILRLFYRSKQAFEELPPEVDRYLYRRLFKCTLQTGFHSPKTAKSLSNLLFSVITNDESETRAIALFKRMLQSTFAQISVFTSFMFKAVFRILEEKPAFWKYIKEPEKNRDEGDDKHYELTEGNPSYMNADRSAMWELVALRSHVNPTISKYCSFVSMEQVPNVNSIIFEELHYNDILNSLVVQGKTSRLKHIHKHEKRTASAAEKEIPSVKDHLGFEEKFTSLSRKKGDKKKYKLSSEHKAALNEILYDAEGDEEDEKRALMEIEGQALPSTEELQDIVENDVMQSKKYSGKRKRLPRDGGAKTKRRRKQ